MIDWPSSEVFFRPRSVFSTDRQEAAPATTRAAVTTVTVPPNVMRYGPHPYVRSTANVDGVWVRTALGNAEPTSRSATRSKAKKTDAPRNPAAPATTPNPFQFTVPRVNSLLTMAKSG